MDDVHYCLFSNSHPDKIHGISGLARVKSSEAVKVSNHGPIVTLPPTLHLDELLLSVVDDHYHFIWLIDGWEVSFILTMLVCAPANCKT